MPRKCCCRAARTQTSAATGPARGGCGFWRTETLRRLNLAREGKRRGWCILDDVGDSRQEVRHAGHPPEGCSDREVDVGGGGKAIHPPPIGCEQCAPSSRRPSCGEVAPRRTDVSASTPTTASSACGCLLETVMGGEAGSVRESARLRLR
jgi:hypothetical protein